MELFILTVKLNVTKLLNSLSFLNSLNFFLRWQGEAICLYCSSFYHLQIIYISNLRHFLLNEVNGLIMLCNSQCAIYIIKAEDDIEYS